MSVQWLVGVSECQSVGVSECQSVGEISQHGLVRRGVAPSLEIKLTTTTTVTPRRHSITAFYFYLCGGLVHGALRHRQYFYQDGAGPATRGPQ